MFWPFLGISAIAVGFIQLGALTVWVVVLKAMLALAVTVALLLGSALVWQQYKGPDMRQ